MQICKYPGEQVWVSTPRLPYRCYPRRIKGRAETQRSLRELFLYPTAPRAHDIISLSLSVLPRYATTLRNTKSLNTRHTQVKSNRFNSNSSLLFIFLFFFPSNQPVYLKKNPVFVHFKNEFKTMLTNVVNYFVELLIKI